MTSGHITCTTTLSSSDLSYISLCQIESLSSHLNESTYPPLPVDESSLNEHTHLLTEFVCCELREDFLKDLCTFDVCPILFPWYRSNTYCWDYVRIVNRYLLGGRYVTWKNLASIDIVSKILVGRFVCWGWRSFEVFLLGYTNWYNGGYYCVYIYPDDRYKQQTRWDWKAIICAHMVPNIQQ